MTIKEIEAIKSDIYMMQEASRRVWNVEEYKTISKTIEYLIKLVEKQVEMTVNNNNYYKIGYCPTCSKENQYGGYCSNCGITLKQVKGDTEL